MEFILKLAYTIPRAGENFEENTPPKEKQNIRKKIIQDEFIIKLGLKVDCPRYGYGNTNDGNAYGTFFEKHSVTAEITGVNVNVIDSFHF